MQQIKKRKNHLIYCPICLAQRKMKKIAGGWQCIDCENKFEAVTFEFLPEENE